MHRTFLDEVGSFGWDYVSECRHSKTGNRFFALEHVDIVIHVKTLTFWYPLAFDGRLILTMAIEYFFKFILLACWIMIC